MHKAYQSILPCQSRILKERWDRKYYDEHRDKVREAKSVVDTKPPRTYVHLHLKLKKLQLEEERLATIERDNRILLEKMSEIMRTKGRVDNHNDYISKSLNREKRQRELLRVTRENQEILKRILAREPEYNHLQWEKDWEENEQFMDNVSRYPRDWWELQQKEEETRKEELMEKRRKQRQADRKADRQAERKADRQAERKAERQAERKAERQAERKAERQAERKAERQRSKSREGDSGTEDEDRPSSSEQEKRQEEEAEEKKLEEEAAA